jgi:chromosome segregation ATPase
LRQEANAIGPDFVSENEKDLDEEVENLKKLLDLKSSIGSGNIDEYSSLESLKEIVMKYAADIENNPDLLIGIKRFEYLDNLVTKMRIENERSRTSLGKREVERDELENQLRNKIKEIEDLKNTISERENAIESILEEVDELQYEDPGEYRSSSSMNIIDQRDQLLLELKIEGYGETDLSLVANEIEVLQSIKEMLGQAGDISIEDLLLKQQKYSNPAELRNIEKMVRKYAIPVNF